jgi:hypothetical protein
VVARKIVSQGVDMGFSRRMHALCALRRLAVYYLDTILPYPAPPVDRMVLQPCCIKAHLWTLVAFEVVLPPQPSHPQTEYAATTGNRGGAIFGRIRRIPELLWRPFLQLSYAGEVRAVDFPELAAFSSFGHKST